MSSVRSPLKGWPWRPGWSEEARAQGAGFDEGTCGSPGGCVSSGAAARFGLEVRGTGRPCGLRAPLCEWSLQP